MTFTAYIQRQKSLIRSRREGEIYQENKREEILPEYDTELLLEDLTAFKGLNTAERQQYSKIFLSV